MVPDAFRNGWITLEEIHTLHTTSMNYDAGYDGLSAEAVSYGDEWLSDWRQRALELEAELGRAVIGQPRLLRLLIIAVFARGHALLEGDVGVGKTTVLRALARTLGGAYARIEGTIDLMPADLIYHAYIDEQGRPAVMPGPLLASGEQLATFFFNEVNRARPQVHALLLRVMAERSASAFNREHQFPHLQVFADRNRVEREETFELPVAARDRFLMEIPVLLPTELELQRELMFATRFHDVDALIGQLAPAVVPHAELNDIAAAIQESVSASPDLERYALALARATREPQAFGIELEGATGSELILAGLSPRGMSQWLRAARVAAWLDERDFLLPEDLLGVLQECVAHRIVLAPVFELRRAEIAPALVEAIARHVPAP
jgi:MoxR-like ATPase